MVLMDLFSGQKWRDSQKTDLGMQQEGRREETERCMYRKSSLDTYITICKTDTQQEFAVWLRKLKQGLCINLEQ